ncbi:MAG: hypothetical protein ABIS06_01015 [Vicinamibacterales bacterium]
MNLDIYVNYRGTCEQAFRFYEQHLGGTITGVVRHGEQPNPQIPEDWKEKVLHARIDIGTTVLMGRTFHRANPLDAAPSTWLGTTDVAVEQQELLDLFACVNARATLELGNRRRPA